MIENQPVVSADPTPAPELEATAAPPESESSTPESADKPKAFSQEEVDALISKRLAREQRKWERTQKAAQSDALKELPPADTFESTEAYADALAERKAQELLARREAEKQQTEVLDAYHDREEEARTKYDDFEQVAYNPNLRITDVMAESIRTSDIGPEVAYYLGQNPKDADRISRLSPLSQAKEIGKIEVKLASDPPARKTTSAPDPIRPVAARNATNPAYDTTDPRSIKSMSTSEWIEADRQRQIRKLQAQR
jgi:hypothetical protein